MIKVYEKNHPKRRRISILNFTGNIPQTGFYKIITNMMKKMKSANVRG